MEGEEDRQPFLTYVVLSGANGTVRWGALGRGGVWRCEEVRDTFRAAGGGLFDRPLEENGLRNELEDGCRQVGRVRGKRGRKEERGREALCACMCINASAELWVSKAAMARLSSAGTSAGLFRSFTSATRAP